MPLSHEEFLKLPIIPLQGVEGFQPADYSALQLFLQPYLGAIQTIWWILFAGVLLYLAAHNIVRPLLIAAKTGADISCPPTVTDDVPEEPPATSFWGKARAYYIRIFSIREIQQDVALRLYGGAILIGYLATFRMWQMDTTTTVDAIDKFQVTCWPFFQSCSKWIWMQTLPYGYSQTVFFMVMFALMIFAAWALFTRRVVAAHATIFVLFIARVYMTLIDFYHNGNFDYYHTTFNIVFLFLPRKRFFGSLMIVLFYFLSCATKIHPSWTWGGYFNSMRDGLPLVPRGTEAVLTNFIIFMEMLMSWFMFSRNKYLQRGVFAFFCFFHVYSGTLVGYHYPSIVMPPLVIFFGTLFRPFPTVPLSRAAIPGWTLVALLLAIQMYSHTIPGDTKLTLEGDHYGLYMFEANHECRIVYMDEGGKVLQSRDNVVARNRCNPWEYLTHGQQRFCRDHSVGKVRFAMIHSVNGGPFYQIVDEPDLCSLHYTAFGHNEWIKDENTAPIVGRPLENYYR